MLDTRISRLCRAWPGPKFTSDVFEEGYWLGYAHSFMADSPWCSVELQMGELLVDLHLGRVSIEGGRRDGK